MPNLDSHHLIIIIHIIWLFIYRKLQATANECVTKGVLLKKKKEDESSSKILAHLSHHLNVCDLTFTDVLSQDDNQTVINCPEEPSWYGVSFHEAYTGDTSSPLQPPSLEADTFLH